MTEQQQRERLLRVVDALNAAEVHATLLGTEEDRHRYAGAIIGIIWEPQPSVAYSRTGILRALMEMNDWNEEEALEWYEYNTVRGICYIPKADHPPTIVDDIE